MDAARTTRGADTGSIDSGMTDRGRGRRAGAALCTALCTAGAALLALTDAGAAMLGTAMLGAAMLGAATPGFFIFINSSCTIVVDEGAIPGFLSFFGCSCDTSGAALIDGATPGFLSFGAALGSAATSAIGGPSAIGAALLALATPGFLSFGTALGCSCARRGRD